jgi:hypothetical protein
MTQLNAVPPQSLLKTDSVIFAGMTLTGLTSSRLVATDGADALTSVANLQSWIAGTSNQIVTADDGDGTITLSTPQNIHTGATNFTVAGLTISGLAGSANYVAGYTTGGLLTSTNLSFTANTLTFTGDITYTGSFELVTTGYDTTFLKLRTVSDSTKTYISFRDSGIVTMQCQDTSGGMAFDLMTKDGDATDACYMNIFAAQNMPDCTNIAILQFGYTPTGNKYILWSAAAGSGTGVAVYPIHIYTGTNAGQLVCNTDGTISIGSLSGLLKGTAGVVSAITDNSSLWNGITAAGTGFIKQTPSGTFADDTFGTQYYIPVSTGTGFSYNAALISDASYNLIGTGYARFNGGLGINGNPTAGNFIHNYNPSTAGTVGYFLISTSVWNGPGTINTLATGINFSSFWIPAAGATGNRTVSLLQGGYGNIIFDVRGLIDSRNYIVTVANAYNTVLQLYKDSGTLGTVQMTAFNHYRAGAISNTGSVGIPTVNAFYDSGQTAGTTNNWGLAINTANNYIGGSLSIGKVTAPTIPLDVVGAILNTTTIEAGTGFRCGGTAPCADNTYALPTSITTKGGIITAIS